MIKQINVVCHSTLKYNLNGSMTDYLAPPLISLAKSIYLQIPKV